MKTTMAITGRVLGIAAASLLLASCGGSSGSSSGAGEAGAASTFNLAGNYTGTVNSSAGGGSGTVAVTLAQNGTALSGSGRFTSASRAASHEGEEPEPTPTPPPSSSQPSIASCFSNFSVSGNVNGSQVNITITNGGNRATGSGSATSNRITSSYQVTSGACSGDRGSITINK